MNSIVKISLSLGTVALGIAAINAIGKGSDAKWNAKVKIAELNAKNQNKEKEKQK